jgi:asparagine synthase (glutamine-hydrolysing)
LIARLHRRQTGLVPEVPGPVWFDGRIDNADDLIRGSGAAVAVSDAALVLAAAYRRWGTACAAHVLGDFSLVVWDAERRSLYCARDPAGTRPLFYALGREHVAAGSRAHQVRAAAGLPAEADEEYIAAKLLGAGYSVPADRTQLRGVRRLLPGHWLLIRGDQVESGCFWAAASAPPIRYKCRQDYDAAFTAILRSAVACRLPPRGQVGLHVSGGLDSSTVALMTCAVLRSRGRVAPLGFSWLPTDVSSRERRAAVALARALRIDLYSLFPSVSELAALLTNERDLEPNLDALYQEAPVQRAAQALGVHTILSGWGGDEGISSSGGRLARVVRDAPNPPAGSYAAPDLVARFRPKAEIAMHSRRAQRLSRIRGRHLAERMEQWAEHGRQLGISYAYPLLDRRVVEFALGVPHDVLKGRGVVHRYLQALAPTEVVALGKPDEVTRVRALQKVLRSALLWVRYDVDAVAARPLARFLDIPKLVRAMRPENMPDDMSLFRLARAVRVLWG